ncbi:iron chelate uptake ABC transporter family permease subunit [Klebsiella pneumoniae]
MQGLFRNPLADPGLLGISSGARAGGGQLAGAPVLRCGADRPVYADAGGVYWQPAVMVVIFILSRAEEGSLSRLLLVGDRHQRAVRRAGRRPVLAEQ